MSRPAVRIAYLSSLLACGLAGCGDDGAVNSEAGTGSTTGADGTSTAPVTSTTEDPATTSQDGSSSSSTGSDTLAESSSSTGEPEQLDPIPWSRACQVGANDLHALNPDLECAAIEVPLDWNNPESETIVVALSRLRTAEPRQGEVWMLDGGPGGSGLGFIVPGSSETILAGGFDVVVMSHRGTISPRLDCGFGAQSPSCRDELEGVWGADLRHFNTEQAARDLGHAIARSEAEGDEHVVVYGVSYGTFWAEHYAGLYPDQADGIVFDSVLSADADVTLQEVHADERAREIVARCFADPECASNLEAEDADALVQQAVDAFNLQDCGNDPGGWEQAQFKGLLGVLTNAARARNYVPLVLAMLAECDPVLTEAVESAYFSLLSGAGIASSADPLPLASWGIDPSLFSSAEVFGVVLGTSVMEDGAVPIASVEGGAASIGFGDNLVANAEVWNDLPDNLVTLEVPTTPVLILSSSFDIQTPPLWAESLGSRYGVVPTIVEDGAHSLRSGVGGRLLDGAPCVSTAIVDFATTPSSDFTAECFEQLPALDPSLSRPDLQAMSLAAFGTADPWSLLPNNK
ncbi:MAG: alpha/beta fold hydrolase [Nannocystales bacterium]